jgi:exonuclease SbcD
MGFTKIIHTADVHLDSPLKSLALRNPDLRDRLQTASRAAFCKIIQTCIDEEVSALLISGDLFDGGERSAKTAAFLLSELDRLGEANVEVFYIKGNHDADNPNVGNIEFPNNVHVFDGRGGSKQLLDTNIYIHGVSFSGSKAPESLLSKFKTPIPNATNIAMLHTSLAGSESHDVYAPCSVSELCNMGFDYWALGHIHKRETHSEDPLIIMPGMPQGRDIGELGPKSATLLEISEGNISLSEVPTSIMEFQKVKINVGGIDDDDNIREQIRACLSVISESLSSESGILRIELIGQTERYWNILRSQEIWKETVKNILEPFGNLWLDKLQFEIIRPSSLQEHSGSALAEIETLMADLGSDPGLTESISQVFESINQELSASRRNILFQNEEAENTFKKSLLEKGVQEIIAGMKGGVD